MKIKNVILTLVAMIIVLTMITGCAGKGASVRDAGAKESADSKYTEEVAGSESADVTSSDEVASSESSDSSSVEKDALSIEAEKPSAEKELPTAPDTMGDNPETPLSQNPKPEAGLLTAGEWNDNENYDFWLDLFQKNREWTEFSQSWDMNVSRRIVADVCSKNDPIANAKVELVADDGNVVWTGKTNNQGRAYLFNGIEQNPSGSLSYIRATVDQEEQKIYIENPATVHKFDFANQQIPQEILEISLVVDTTGSMGDELDYLKSELEGVVNRVSKDNANIPIRTSALVYRDVGDQYVVRSNKFTENVKDTTKFLSKQTAGGGGDWEEAVEQALDAAINGQKWNKEATARIMLLVLDAPPHNTADIRKKMLALTVQAADEGIVIIPIASSGIDKSTEYLLRSIAISTGGTYVFLTDDSGIGNAHIEPTVGYYQVESLDDLLVRVINEYVN